jgi:hypothetical protein
MTEALAGEENRERAPRHIVDGHNQALFYWAQAGIKDALLVHIDRHPDTVSGAPTLDAARILDPTLPSSPLNYPYVSTSLTVGNFLVAACQEKIVGPMVWLDPLRPSIHIFGQDAYGRLIPPRTKIVDGKIEWVDRKEIDGEGFTIHTLHGEVESKAMAIHKIQEDSRDIILDIDLDALLCVHDPEIFNTENVIGVKKKQMRALISALQKKRIKVVTIATSQTPSTWTPPEKVSSLLHTVTELLDSLQI